MKYQHWSTETLEHEKKKLLEYINEWEETLRQTSSYLIVVSLTHSIKKTKEKVHAIEAELCYRTASQK